MKDFPRELRFTVDLDEDKGIKPNPNRPNKHNIRINHASGGKNKDGAINMAALEAYLEGKMSFDTSVLEAISV